MGPQRPWLFDSFIIRRDTNSLCRTSPCLGACVARIELPTATEAAPQMQLPTRLGSPPPGQFSLKLTCPFGLLMQQVDLGCASSASTQTSVRLPFLGLVVLQILCTVTTLYVLIRPVSHRPCCLINKTCGLAPWLLLMAANM